MGTDLSAYTKVMKDLGGLQGAIDGLNEEADRRDALPINERLKLDGPTKKTNAR